jgi:hypothetical protein
MFTFFMMLPVSDFLWKVFPILQIIQFPWRFNTVLSAAAAPLIAMGIAALKRPLTTRNIVLVQVCYVCLVGWLYLTTVCVWQQHLIPGKDASFAMPASHDPPEYCPRNVKMARHEVIAKFGGTKHGLVLNNANDTRIVSSSSREIRIATDIRTNRLLRIRQFFYYGWTAFVDGKQSSIQPSNPEGLIEVAVPAGTHEILVALSAQWPEKISKEISGASILISLILAVRLFRSRRQTIAERCD